LVVADATNSRSHTAGASSDPVPFIAIRVPQVSSSPRTFASPAMLVPVPDRAVNESNPKLNCG